MLTVLLSIYIATFLMLVNGIIVKDPPPIGNEYRYSYNIEDPTTGDEKSLYEVRQNNVVSGSYSVLDPDGTRRTVQYTADAKGFRASVTQEPVQDLPEIPQKQQRILNEYHNIPSDGYLVYSYKHQDDPAKISVDVPREYTVRSPLERLPHESYFTPTVMDLSQSQRKWLNKKQYFTPSK